eukprot:8147392-Prorocentrum_lima.AAC.1
MLHQRTERHILADTEPNLQTTLTDQAKRPGKKYPYRDVLGTGSLNGFDLAKTATGTSRAVA